jgi:cytidylate kinase
MKKLIVAIDGPSGAGKSTLSKLIAGKLGYVNIDTGAMYRTVALAVSRAGINLADLAALQPLLETIRIDFKRSNSGDRVLLNDEDVSQEIRTPEISLLTPKIAAVHEVREAMVARQREMGAAGGVVLEGRDIGSVVFPLAEVKLFMVASAEERGKRRYDELVAKGLEVDLQQTIIDVEERDRADSQREHSPLVKAEDAVEIDTTGLDIEQVLEVMLDVVANRQSVSGG